MAYKRKSENIKRRADYFAYSDGDEYKGKSMVETFSSIMLEKKWVDSHDQESISGTGSALQQTRQVRLIIESLRKRLGLKAILDIPCGDFNWMREFDLADMNYKGADVLPKLIEHNQQNHETTQIQFQVLDITRDKLPESDLILCRDCLVHFSFRDIADALRRITESSSKYLLMTTFTNQEENEDVVTGGWRPLNFLLPPFNLPSPVEVFNENCTEMNGVFNDKSLGLWSIEALRKHKLIV
jgi:hypothetical protein